MASSKHYLIAVNKKQHIFVNGIECKECASCKQTKSIENFGKNNRRWDKLHMYCKPCWVKYTKQYKDSSPKLSETELKESYNKRKDNIRKGVKEYYNKNKQVKSFKHEQINKKEILNSINNLNITTTKTTTTIKLYSKILVTVFLVLPSLFKVGQHFYEYINK